MSRYAYERVVEELAMPGVFEITRGPSVREAIEELLIVAQCSVEGEWEGQVRHLPL
jgi:hypothetical protein